MTLEALLTALLAVLLAATGNGGVTGPPAVTGPITGTSNSSTTAAGDLAVLALTECGWCAAIMRSSAQSPAAEYEAVKPSTRKSVWLTEATGV